MVVTFLATDCVSTFERLLSDNLWSSSDISSGKPSVPRGTTPVVGKASKDNTNVINKNISLIMIPVQKYTYEGHPQLQLFCRL